MKHGRRPGPGQRSKTEAEFIAMKTPADLTRPLANNDQAAVNYVKQVHNSFTRW
jgi:hypothetical protein